MQTDTTQRDPLEQIASEFVAERRAGAAPAVEDYAARYPDYADDIRALFPTLLELEAAHDTETSHSDGFLKPHVTTPERLGDFRIVREVGRGGMGVVYEAVQESLGRRVALKVLPANWLRTPQHLARFQQEARAAARLHHTNIVPIFGVGHADGHHYIVMQFIDGVSLDAEIAAREQTERRPRVAHWRRVARIGAQAARALAYAHHHGVLHRDLKPGNLLLDGEETLWVADFGLAKVLEQEGLTEAEDVIGTLRYMSPERFEGGGDQRSDIYSLGLTLFELACGTPAFGTQRRSELIGEIMRGSPPRLRQNAPDVPRDLETIIHKCIERDPDDRYPDAQALADDLQNWLEDRPIRARRVSKAEHVWRWARRNRGVAVLLAVVMVTVTATAMVSASAYFVTAKANQEASSALMHADAQRRRAERLLNLALAALDTIFEEASPEPSTKARTLTLDDEAEVTVQVEPVVTPEIARLLTHMLSFYRTLAAEAETSDAVRMRVVAANRRVGDIHAQLGEYEAAQAAYEDALEGYQALATAAREDARLVIGLARTQNQLGLTEALRGDPRAGRARHAAALDLLAELRAKDEALAADLQFERARTHYLLGRRIPDIVGPPGRGPRGGGMGRGPGGPGPGWGRRSGGGFRRGPGPPRPGGMPGELGGGPPVDGPGSAWSHGARVAQLSSAIDALTALIAEVGERPAYTHLLARCYRELPPGPGGDPAKLEEAIALLETLVARFPDVSQYKFDLAEAYAATPPARPRRAENAAVLERLRQATEISEGLLREHPHVAEYAAAAAYHQHRLGVELLRSGKADAAVEALRRAVEISDAAHERFSEAAHRHVAGLAFRIWLSRGLAYNGELDEAAALLEAAREELAGLDESRSDRGPEMRLLRHVSRLLEDTGRQIRRRRASENMR